MPSHPDRVRRQYDGSMQRLMDVAQQQARCAHQMIYHRARHESLCVRCGKIVTDTERQYLK